MTRVDGPRTADVEFLGVYVRYQHNYVTGFFGRTFTVERAVDHAPRARGAERMTRASHRSVAPAR